VQRELVRLLDSGLVTMTTIGPLKRYQANRAAPIFEELRSIIEKTSGVPAVLHDALTRVATSIIFAAMYGSLAKATDQATSDIDVLVISDTLALAELFEALAPAERKLGRRVSPTLYSRDEFRKRRRAKHPFLTKVLGGEHVVLMGTEDAALASR
jgi:predicted nucleotidyltransferase